MKKIVSIIVGSIVLGIACLVLAIYPRQPAALFSPTMKDGEVEFHIALKNARGFLRLIVWEKESKKTLWNVGLNYFPGPSIKYGDVPRNFKALSGLKHSAKQDFPDGVAPSPIPKGKIIHVCLDYQFDMFLTPSSRLEFFAFRVEPNGDITDIGKIPHPGWGQMADFFDPPASSK